MSIAYRPEYIEDGNKSTPYVVLMFVRLYFDTNLMDELERE